MGITRWTDLPQIKPAAILDIGAHHGYTVDKLLDYAPGAKVTPLSQPRKARPFSADG